MNANIRPYTGLTISNFADWVEAGWSSRGNPVVDIAVMTIGMVSEAGEAADIVKKHLRGDGPIAKQELLLELGDVLHYVVRVARQFDISLDDIMVSNIEKIEARRGKRKFEVAT